MNPKVDQYLLDGCMRCDYGATPKCKVHRWKEELVALRQIVLQTALLEDHKWGVPCYTYQNKNVLILAAFKDYAFISFFKGELLADTEKRLIKNGENTQHSRLLRFTSLTQILQQEKLILDYINEAIEIEKTGVKPSAEKQVIDLPIELLEAFADDQEFKQAFYTLTPGRQRAYLIHFSQAKQSKSRLSRIHKYKSQILRGEGLHDAYQRKNK